MNKVKGDLDVIYSALVKGKYDILNEVYRLLYVNETTKTIPDLDQIVLEFVPLFDQCIGLLNDELDTKKMRAFAKKITTINAEFCLTYAQFLECINIARNTSIDYLYASSLNPEEKVDGIKVINHFYFLLNNYLYEYLTTEKNKELIEKSRFIERMNHDRLTILGKLSTSFAHEFRNPLTSIKGFVQLLEERTIRDEEAQHYIDIIKTEIALLEDNVSQFLLLSTDKSHEDYHETDFCFVELIEEVLRSHHPVFVDKNIRVIKRMEQPMGVKGVFQQIKQVLIHIFNNAVDALLCEPGPRLLLVQSYVEDELACVSVKNNGPKIPDHLVKNIFDPFISTKELASGLGLSVCKQIIEKHEGELLCHSTNEITNFTFKLKLVDQEMQKH